MGLRSSASSGVTTRRSHSRTASCAGQSTRERPPTSTPTRPRLRPARCHSNTVRTYHSTSPQIRVPCGSQRLSLIERVAAKETQDRLCNAEGGGPCGEAFKRSDDLTTAATRPLERRDDPEECLPIPSPGLLQGSPHAPAREREIREGQAPNPNHQPDQPPTSAPGPNPINTQPHQPQPNLGPNLSPQTPQPQPQPPAPTTNPINPSPT
ncbi:leucine-rich repeat extensin-like protein 5 [Penaeus chinensis]|uniref:leucine-rich repeat extensin-like protein 5 n=1 Tax=Penaeus chinensis TaxID=139456 RepID=UPI001FB62B50|nr:leucine-rich repeat extensin-like protein 5 [Penaeus chinensis]